jgi:hypothetical protein
LIFPAEKPKRPQSRRLQESSATRSWGGYGELHRHFVVSDNYDTSILVARVNDGELNCQHKVAIFRFQNQKKARKDAGFLICGE